MRVLLVEDDSDLASYIRGMLAECFPDRVVEVAADRASAVDAIDGDEPIELVVCDLRIPSRNGAADADEAHGKAVQAYLAVRRPGVPCIFLSAYAKDHVDSLVSSAALGGAARVEPGGEMIQLIQVAEKENLLKFREKVEELAAVIDKIESRQVDCEEEIAEVDKRILQLALANRGVQRGNATVIPGGLTGAHTYRLDGLGDDGAVVAYLFVKIDEAEDIRDEYQRYEKNIPGSLRDGDYATFVAHIQWFSGGTQALVFRFSDYMTGSIFDALKGDSDYGIESVQRVFEPWSAAAVPKSFSVRSLRRRRVPDEVCQEAGLLGDADVISLESATFEAPNCRTHGDLHGGNALLSGESVCLIDYGDVGESVGCLDAVTLELSLWTHHQGRELASPWPSIDHARLWWDLDSYLDGCPFPQFVRSCRDWALTSVNGDESVLVATVYVHSARQLKYPDVPKELAMAFIQGCAQHWREL